jgi:hypothetical protein
VAYIQPKNLPRNGSGAIIDKASAKELQIDFLKSLPEERIVSFADIYSRETTATIC